MSTATIVSIVATVLGAIAAVASVWSARAASKSARVAENVDRRARTPRLVVTLDRRLRNEDPLAMYWVLNEGPQDLDSISVKAPTLSDGLTYQVASEGDELAEQANLGSLQIGSRAVFKLTVPPNRELPVLWVAFTCSAGKETPWGVPQRLDPPR